MGFLLVFFPEESQSHHHESKKKPFHFIRTNSIQFLYKAQSTISIFSLLLFTAVLLYIFSTLPSSSSSLAAARRLYSVPRRQLSSSGSKLPHALQGMGVLYRRGVRAMTDLIVAHATESLTQHELRLFVRLFYTSSLASRSDLLFIFPTRLSSFDDVILQESNSFLKLLALYRKKPSNDSHSFPSSDLTSFLKLSKKEKQSGEPIWGRRTRPNFNKQRTNESTRPSYGSVVGFEVQELDPDNSLSGFVDPLPTHLRRWACYPMLLGRVRRNFKHVTLLDMKEMLLLGDPLSRVRSQSPETVLFQATTRKKKLVHPGIIMGGSRGVRRLSGEMLTAIVRASMEQQRRKKNPLTDSDVFNRFVRNEYALKNMNVNVIVSTEPVPELSSKSGLRLVMKNYSVVRRGNSDFDYVVMKQTCSFPEASTVYSGC